MSFLLRVASQARSMVPDIPVARPKGLLPGLVPPAGPPIQEALPSAPAPIHQAPRPGPPPVSDAAPKRASEQPLAAPAPAPAAVPSPADISAPKDPGSDMPPVVERRSTPAAAAEEDGSPAEPLRVTPPDAGASGRPALTADVEPASDTPDSRPPSRPDSEIAGPPDRADTRIGLPDHPVEPPRSATQAQEDAGAAPDQAIDRHDVASRIEPARQAGDDAPVLEPRGPGPADRLIEEGHGRPVEVLPIAQPLTPSPTPPPAERALQRPAAAEKQPLLQIDQIDVVVTDPAPMPAPARSALAAVAADRRYLRRL